MNIMDITIEQRAAIVALRPVLDARYQHLCALLAEASEEKDIEMWKLNLALTDLEAVLEVMLPRYPEDEDY
jgi:hypothetical protein